MKDIDSYRRITGEAMPYTLVYLDEANAVLGDTIPKQLRVRIDAALKNILQRGRSSGVVMSVGAQYLTADLFDREGSKQFAIRMYFGSWDQAAISMIFHGQVDRETAQRIKPYLTGHPGRGLLVGPGTSPQPFQSIYVSEEDILDAIRRVRSQADQELLRSMFDREPVPATSRVDPRYWLPGPVLDQSTDADDVLEWPASYGLGRTSQSSQSDQGGQTAQGSSTREGIDWHTLSRRDQIINRILQGASNNEILRTVGTRGTGLTKSQAHREINRIREELRGKSTQKERE